MTVIIECISWLINVTVNNDAQWKPKIICEGGSYLTRHLANPYCTHYFKAKVLVIDYFYSKDTDRP